MNASQDTKVGPSVVAETLRSLSEQAKVCHEKIDLAEAGQSFSRADVLAEVGKLLDACQNLRDAILSEDGGANWTTKSELSALVQRLDDVAAKRRRYLDLAQVLATGTITHRRERTRLERLTLRDKAVAELMEISEQPTPPELPGPSAESWLEWACSLEDDTNEIELHKLKNGFPRLDDFVRQLEIDWWHEGPAPEKAEKRKSALAVLAAISGSHSNGNRNGALKQPVVEQEPVALAPADAPAPAESATVVEPETAVEAAPVAGAAPIAFSDDIPADAPVLNSASVEAPSDEEAVELPLESLNPNRNGVISFFPWEQVDQFTRRIETADVVRKDARTIRALLAVSHWIEPRDQNPMTHAKCGIRALTGYPITSEPTYVSPSDVMQFIAQDDGLPLLTGGADLLRWGLLQPSERNFQGVAAVRRFTPDHLKAWFSEVFRIALSDKQIDDIYNLTSGIPYLIGQLHRLIIPMPDDPPTWLGLARWMDIKAQFEKQMPEFTHDLKKGAPVVRLTDRELSLLNMVVIVSADSTRETIVANLSENWEKYQHPEYRAMSSRDEVSLAVLMELGLLPRLNATGGVPSKALVPVKQDDAIRKIAEHL
ncbi:MAG TPA: hypothetical protein VK574_13990 [Terracidiphilus sp.]|nr:hypothetical protein [Terracidiphilus sp.]